MNVISTKKFLPLLVSIFILLFNIGIVFADAPLDVHIEALETIGTSGEAFTATGPAVDTGLVCAAGTTADLSVTVAGAPQGDILILNVHKRLTCDDASGSFDIKMVVRLNTVTNETSARWRIISGTGAYSGLKGNGALVGIPVVPGTSILDIYDGKVK